MALVDGSIGESLPTYLAYLPTYLTYILHLHPPSTYLHPAAIMCIKRNKLASTPQAIYQLPCPHRTTAHWSYR